jgi:hypothetical protein
MKERCTAMTAKGRPCQAAAIPNESVFVLHLPKDDPRRLETVADIARRTKAYWERWRAAVVQGSTF